MVLITILALAVLAFVGKLIYDVQQNKNQQKETYNKKQFQKLAGIGQPKKEIDSEIWKYIANKVGEEKFPEPDPSIPISATKITTIDTNFGDNDPLATIPMSRISVEGKKKMAQIAKEDIKITTEAKANELISKGLATLPTEKKTKRTNKKKATK